MTKINTHLALIEFVDYPCQKSRGGWSHLIKPITPTVVSITVQVPRVLLTVRLNFLSWAVRNLNFDPIFSILEWMGFEIFKTLFIKVLFRNFSYNTLRFWKANCFPCSCPR